jgi:hypothetical protein
MLRGNDLAWAIAGVLIIGALVLAVFQLSSDARLRKRRRKNHGRLVAKSDRPMVKFSVKPPKE